jgi:hypothetical protein
MTRLLTGLILLVFSAVGCQSVEVITVEFDGTKSEHKWALHELNPPLPSDWSDYEFLVMEMRASSPQRFYLSFYSGDLVQSRRMHPLANGWIRTAVPLRYYREPNRAGHDMASVGKVPRNSFWVGTGGKYGPLDSVEAIAVSMEYPFGKPTLEIRSVQLAKDDPGSEVLEPKPLVDEFGQWIPSDWPGKIKNLEQLQQEWSEEDQSLGQGDFNYGKYGGYQNTQSEATGFFRVEQVDGKWWFVDPEGHLFFSTCSTGMGGRGSLSRTQGRESYYAALPPSDLGTMRYGRPVAPGFYSWNLFRRFGSDWKSLYTDLAIRRLEDWGLNTIGNWSDSALWDKQQKPYVVFLGGWGMRGGSLGMPDVYSEEWPGIVDKAAAEQCAPRKDDPYLVGYFIGNEPPWPGKESLVVDIILDGEPTAIQEEARQFLADGDTPERRKAFVYKAFERFAEVINAAVKKHDPNHLNLGLRFGGHAPPKEMLLTSKSFDVYSMNSYRYSLDREVIEQIYQVTELPIIIGEFHFGVPENGLAAGLVQVSSQKERGVAYRYYVEQAAALPALIGTSWFQWVDQSVTGRMDGENYNIGLVDVTDRPYPEMVAALKATHKRLYAVHSGAEPPFNQKPKVQ